MSNLRMVESIYSVLVNRVPGIQERYKEKRASVKGIQRGSAWAYLLWLNTSYYVFGRKQLGVLQKYPYFEKKSLYASGSESSLEKYGSPVRFAEALSEYDVVSFDVFDTLVLRPFSSPADLFFLLGDELGYMDFKRIRMESEWRAREKKNKKEKHHEVTLEEIYEELGEQTGLNPEKVMEREIELEYEYCFANPYMSRVVDELRKRGKRIIVTSDMYLNKRQIEILLERCGLGLFDGIYVSCDFRKSKNKGDLYDEVMKKEQQLAGRRLSFIHTGDNYFSDIEQARKHGIASRHYVNVNEAGGRFRPEDMSVITGSVYRGLVNAHIHNGLKVYSREYEYGYIYGGLFVTGYCQFIHRYVRQHSVDRILFLARDGDILMKAYQLLYPEEKEKCRYTYWSRLAATKMAAQYFKYDYFRRFLYHKVNQGYLLDKIFHSMELDDMLDELRREKGYTDSTELTDKNVDKIKQFLMERWSQVLDHYEEQLEAGSQYFIEILGNCRRAVAVDIGWAGSGAITLNYIVNSVWNMDCKITGIIAGTNTCHNAEPDASETFLQNGKLISYLYSQRENRDLWKFHDPGKNHNLYWEALLDAPHGSLKGFYLDEKGHCECRFKESVVDEKRIEEVQKGVLDFAEQYKKLMDKSKIFSGISGRDAYAPMLIMEWEGNSEFMKNVSGIMDEMNVG